MDYKQLSGRITRTLGEIKKYIIEDVRLIEPLYHNDLNINLRYPTEDIRKGYVGTTNPIFWGGCNKYSWMKAVITPQTEHLGKTLLIRVRTDSADGWDIANPQFKVFYEGEFIRSLDINHTDLFIENCISREYTYEFNVFSGLDDVKCNIYFEYGIFNEPVQGLYYDLETAHKVFIKLPDNTYAKETLGKIIIDAVNIIDFSHAHKDKSLFVNSIFEASKLLKSMYIPENHFIPIVNAVGHTHIDIAWLWNVEHTRDKAARSFLSVCRLLDEYEDFTFFSSQPQLYEFVNEDYPEVYRLIREKVKSNRWEADGGMWVEADCNIPSGESLIRQIYFGKQFFKDEFDIESTILWLPDAFGFSAALPQILKKSGVNYFVTAKLSWNETNTFPYNIFGWKGIDGSEVFSYIISTAMEKKDQVTLPIGFPIGTYNGILDADVVMESADRFNQKELTKATLLPFGFGDGGGGPTKDMVEIGRRMSQSIAGAPKVKFSSVKEYLDGIKQEIPAEKLPKWSGELYLEYHRGTYTSVARIKNYNRRTEFKLQSIEFLQVLDELFGTNSSSVDDNLVKVWKKVLLNQFHDILPGSSIKEVYQVADKEYEWIFETLEALETELMARIVDRIDLGQDYLMVANSLSTRSVHTIYIDIPNWCHGLVDSHNNYFPIQEGYDGKRFFFDKMIDGSAAKTYKMTSKESKEKDSIYISSELIDTPFYKITLNKKGHIISIFDKAFNREVIKEGGFADRLIAYEDMPHNFDAWDINEYYREKKYSIDDVQLIKVIEKGPIRWSLMIERKFMSSTIIQVIKVFSNHHLIEFETILDWQDKYMLLTSESNLKFNTDHVTCDIQFGNIERSVTKNTSWDRAKFEMYAHKWVDMSENGYGVSLINRSKYGHSFQEKKLQLTLLKSAMYPYEDADKGSHHIQYALMPHEGDWREADTISYGYAFNQHFPHLVGKSQNEHFVPDVGLVKSESENIVIETIKKAYRHDGTIIRVYEAFNKRSQVIISIPEKVRSAYACDMMENIIEEIPLENNSLKCDIKPFEIKTFLII